jgi:hypothetical protein
MMPGMPSAAKLTDAVDVIEGVLPRFRETFPSDMDGSFKVEVVPTDSKTYGKDPFDVKVNDIMGITPQESAAIFATEYDEAIRALLHSLDHYTDFTHEQFHDLLNETKALLLQTMPVPKDISVKDSMPYVEASDLITLGALAFEMYKRQDQVDEQTTKPF